MTDILRDPPDGGYVPQPEQVRRLIAHQDALLTEREAARASTRGDPDKRVALLVTDEDKA